MFLGNTQKFNMSLTLVNFSQENRLSRCGIARSEFLVSWQGNVWTCLGGPPGWKLGPTWQLQ